MLTTTEINKIAEAVCERIFKLTEQKDATYTLTAEQKAEQLGLSYSRFMKVYKTMPSVKYRKLPGRRKVLFKA